MNFKLYCTTLLVALFALSGCGSDDLTVAGEPKRAIDNPVADLVLLPHRAVEGLNQFLQSIPL